MSILARYRGVLNRFPFRGYLFSFGSNTSSRSGQGTNVGNTIVPTQIGSLTNWDQISMCGNYGHAILSGKLYSWGSNSNGRTALGTNVGETSSPTQSGSASNWNLVSGTGNASVGIGTSTLYAWGTNANGATGLGTASGENLSPVQVGSFTDWSTASKGVFNTFAIRNGQLYSCGSGNFGRTALGTVGTGQANVVSLTRVGSFSDWSQVSMDSSHGFAIRDGGKLYSWGTNSNGRTGLNTISGDTGVPTQIGSFTDWSMVQSGASGGFAIRNGVLYSWGSNDSGRTGLNTISGDTLTPTQVGSFTDWESVTGAKNVPNSPPALGIRKGLLYSWGGNLHGATGLNVTIGNTLIPTQVSSFAGWTKIAAAGSITANDTVSAAIRRN